MVGARGGYRNKIIVCSEVGDFVPGGVPFDLKLGGVCAVGIPLVLHKYLPPPIIPKCHYHYLTPILMHHGRAIGSHCAAPTPSLHPGPRDERNTEHKI